MAMSKEKIIADINEHLSKSGKQYYSDFYVGITNDVERRLFNEHNVNKETMWWIYRTANSKMVAQEIEQFYIEKGMQGHLGGGADDSCIVYCYAVGATTYDH
jgi:hypothetical protein